MTSSADVARIAAALGAALPAGAVSDATRAYETEGALPGAVVRASSREDVVATIRAARDLGAAVVPWGGGTQMHLGEAPSRYDIALDLRGLDRVVEYEPADLTASVEAGISLKALQQRLAGHGQWLPLDPPLPDGATIGGVLATNASGPARHALGSARDLLIGVRFVTGGGYLVHSGGRVVKNVAGYDLGKLQIGALGTLGVIVEATFKLAPLPVATQAVSVSGGLSDLMSIISLLDEARLAADAVVLNRQPAGEAWRLLVRFAGGSAAVERSLRDFDTIAQPGSSVERVASLPDLRLDQAVVARASVLPSAVQSICARLAQLDAAVVTYPGAGVLQAGWPADAVSARDLVELRQTCVDGGRGALVLQQAPTELKRQVGVWGATRGDIELMRRVKQQLDPGGILNPGRFVGGI